MPITIEYNFQISDNNHELFQLTLDDDTLELIKTCPEQIPEWARLDYCQCQNCPLKPDLHTYCPLAINLVAIVNRFDNILSHDTLQLEVVTAERRISQQTTAQRAISSLLGLIIACSGCPQTSCFRPMARFHLPLSSEEETIYRSISMYLLAQYFLNEGNRSAGFSLDGLKDIYYNIHLVNSGIAKRLKISGKTDSTVNAVILLDMFTKTIPFVIEDSIDEFRYMFRFYLNDVVRADHRR